MRASGQKRKQTLAAAREWKQERGEKGKAAAPTLDAALPLRVINQPGLALLSSGSRLGALPFLAHSLRTFLLCFLLACLVSFLEPFHSLSPSALFVYLFSWPPNDCLLLFFAALPQCRYVFFPSFFYTLRVASSVQRRGSYSVALAGGLSFAFPELSALVAKA